MYGVQGSLKPPGPLPMHLHIAYMEYSECLPTPLNLDERTCFSQVLAPRRRRRRLLLLRQARQELVRAPALSLCLSLCRCLPHSLCPEALTRRPRRYEHPLDSYYRLLYKELGTLYHGARQPWSLFLSVPVFFLHICLSLCHCLSAFGCRWGALFLSLSS